LKNLPKLKVFSAPYCQIRRLTIANCPKLKSIIVSNNKLTNLDFLNKVTDLDVVIIGENKFPEQDLSIFRKFKNLKLLNLFKTFFQGSLEPLQTCTKLEMLVIGDTNIDSGLEYLPASSQKIYCNNLDPEKKSKKISETLGKYKKIQSLTDVYYELSK